MTEQPKHLPPLEPMTREDVEGVQELCREIGSELETIPHYKAKCIHRILAEIRVTVEETLPGGYAGRHCENCDTILGADDSYVIADDCTICQPCCDGLGDLPDGFNVRDDGTLIVPADILRRPELSQSLGRALDRYARVETADGQVLQSVSMKRELPVDTSEAEPA